MFQISCLALGILACITLNLSTVPIGVNAIEIGEVKCTQNVIWTEAFYKAHEDCRIKIESESKKSDKDEESKPFPRNATLEEFDFDDKCHEHCAYKAVGILTKDDQLPDKKETLKIFKIGTKISDESFSKFTAVWDDCLEKAGKIAKAKKLDKCQTVSLHDFCFFKTVYYEPGSLEVAC